MACNKLWGIVLCHYWVPNAVCARFFLPKSCDLITMSFQFSVMAGWCQDRQDSKIASWLIIHRRFYLDKDDFYFRAKVAGHNGYIRRSCPTSGPAPATIIITLILRNKNLALKPHLWFLIRNNEVVRRQMVGKATNVSSMHQDLKGKC